jgi:plasmid stability protein
MRDGSGSPSAPASSGAGVVALGGAESVEPHATDAARTKRPPAARDTLLRRIDTSKAIETIIPNFVGNGNGNGNGNGREVPVVEMRPSRLDIIDADAIIDVMASITIRDLEPGVKERLRVRAARHGRSMEEEARVVLKTALATVEDGPTDLAAAIQRRFARSGGVELRIPAREAAREPPATR